MRLPARPKIPKVSFNLFSLFSFSLIFFFLFFTLFLLSFSFFKPPKAYLTFRVGPKEILVNFQIPKNIEKNLFGFFDKAQIPKEYQSGFVVPIEASASPRLSFLNNRRVEIEAKDDSLFFSTPVSFGNQKPIGDFWLLAPFTTLGYFEGEIARDFLFAIYDDWPKTFKDFLKSNLDRDLAFFLVEEKDRLETVVVVKKSEEEAKAILGELPRITQDLKKEGSYEEFLGPALKSSKVDNIPISQISLPTSTKKTRAEFGSITMAYFFNTLIISTSEDVLPQVFSSLKGEDRFFGQKAQKLASGLSPNGFGSFIILDPSNFLTKKFPQEFLIVNPQAFSTLNFARIEGVSVVLGQNYLEGVIVLKK